MSGNQEKTTYSFQTEVNQILNLVIHSLYSNKEIFLRELISNASDALDKLRFLAISNSALYENDPDLKIRVSVDEKTKTITISDNGIGMTKEEAIEHLGTIAKSGTKEFLSQLSGNNAKDSQLIGQFGVGFYSAFIVADKVTVLTRKAGKSREEGVSWESKGDGSFTVTPIAKTFHGTDVILHLKEDQAEFLSDWRLRSIIHKYSDHISFPIVMKTTPVPTDKDSTEKQEPKDETVNRATAIWASPKSDITEQQYQEFYKHISHDFENPFGWAHNHVEGKQHYISLLYIPSHAPFDLWQQEARHGLKLYVKRVFIMDEADQFLPRYLRFVKGVVDSADLPLNISREILQENEFVEKIRAANVKRVLGMLEKMAEDEKDKYAKFWSQFGLALKEGPIEDTQNREQIAKLLRFASTHSGTSTQEVSLSDYVSRMKPGQDKIFYIAADSYNTAKNSPHLEIFRKKGIEVLLLSDRIDEWLVSHLSEFQGKHIQSITKGNLDLGELEDKTDIEAQKEAEQDFSKILEHMTTVLGERVKEVRVTHRLTDSPACIVADSYDMGREMQRLLKAAGQEVPSQKPIFEINPKHPLISRLKNETDDARFEEWIFILFDQSMLAESGQLEDPGSYVTRLNKLLQTLT